MSKSLKRVRAALEALGLDIEIVEATTMTKTAAEAAAEAQVDVDQIAKSIIFRGGESDAAVLFVTAGSNRVDPGKAAVIAGEPLLSADAGFIRATTGFAIGGVSPLGHVTPSRTFFDPRLMDFEIIWAAAGTPRHNFAIDPRRLCSVIHGQTADFTA
ncbi:MAG: YbaK/EbsC family protein [Pseudomonadota bacterium]